MEGVGRAGPLTKKGPSFRAPLIGPKIATVKAETAVFAEVKAIGPSIASREFQGPSIVKMARPKVRHPRKKEKST